VRVILDTNVLISGVFFNGPPYQILKAWRDGKIELVISPEILEEYQRIGEALSNKNPSLDIQAFLNLVMVNAVIVSDQPLPEQVSDDPDDEKFLACAISSKTKIIVSGDKHLLRVTGFRGIEVLKPRQFFDEYLSA